MAATTTTTNTTTNNNNNNNNKLIIFYFKNYLQMLVKVSRVTSNNCLARSGKVIVL